MGKLTEHPVSIIVSGRNSSSTLRSCLESIIAQNYPIGEILYFDNASSDDSCEIARSVASESKIPVRIVDGGKTGTLSTSYNRGVQMAKCEIVVLCHSDSMVATNGELRKLVAPLLSDDSISAAYPKQSMPREVWRKFPFWQKFLFSTAVDRLEPTRCATFDAMFRETYLKTGGFNERRFTSTCGYGGEDNEAQVRFGKCGRQVSTDAVVVHLHSFSPDYGFRAYLRTRAMLARTYGKQLRWQGGIVEKSNLLFFVRPVLAILPFIAATGFAVLPQASAIAAVGIAFALQIVFSFLASRKMFSYHETLLDWRILLVLPATWFMIYFETFWFLQGRFTPYADENACDCG